MNVLGRKKPESRKDLLMKWKAEKDLKRKLDAQNKVKPQPFKVTKSAPVTVQHFKKNSTQMKVYYVSYVSVIILQ